MRSVEELHDALRAFRTGEADAYFAASDAMLDRQSPSVIEMTKANRLPSMFYLQRVVAKRRPCQLQPGFQGKRSPI